MKRDMSLIRSLLLKIEDIYEEDLIENMKLEGYSDNEVIYHLEMMFSSNLIQEFEKNKYISGEVDYRVGGISWNGHDYLELIRNDEIWKKTMIEVKEKNVPQNIKYIAEVAGTFVGNLINGINL